MESLHNFDRRDTLRTLDLLPARPRSEAGSHRRGLAPSSPGFPQSRRWHSLLKLLVCFALSLLLLIAWPPPEGYPGGLAWGDAGTPPNTANSQLRMPLRISPETPWVMPGEAVTFAIQAHGDVGISGAELALSLGPDLELLEVRPGPFLGGDTIAAPPHQDSESNQHSYAWARIGPTPSPAPPGRLALVTVRAADGRPWDAWAQARVRLVGADFQAFQDTTVSVDLHVYHRVPSPIPVLPASGSTSGPRPVFALKTLAPGPLQYRIEVSRDDFQTVLHTFDQTISSQGWDREEYPGGQVARVTSPALLEPGEYQWRAYTRVSALDGWSPPGRVARFQVSPHPHGLSGVPPVVARLSAGGAASVTLEGWGFTADTPVYLSTPGEAELPAAVRQWEESRITATLPPVMGPGLAVARVGGAHGSVATAPLLVLPPAWVTVQTALPGSGRVALGEEFSALVWVTNRGADDDSVAVLEARLPDPQYFRLVEVGTGPGGRLLEQSGDRVVLSLTAGAVADFRFRLNSGMASPGDDLDFDFHPQVLGAVSAARWAELESWPIPQRVEAVQRETSETLREMARTFNRAPVQAVENLLTAGPEADLPADLLLRLELYGLDVGPMPGVFQDMPLDAHQISSWRLDPGSLPAGLGSVCCDPGHLRLHVAGAAGPGSGPPDLLAHPPGAGRQSYLSPDRHLSFRIGFPDPAEAAATGGVVRVTAQLGPAIDLETLRTVSSSHPEGMAVQVYQSNKSVAWHFQAGDPPPGFRTPAGEGWVEFTAPLQNDLPSGATVAVRAARVLDFGGLVHTVETNEVLYTIDAAAPAARAGPLAPVQLDPGFQVPWEGSDDPQGSGLAEVVMLVSRDGGPFEVLGRTSEPGVVFQGTPGSTYGFAAVGVDRVGNVQMVPREPDVVVTVGRRLSYPAGIHLVGIPLLEKADPWDFLDAPDGDWRVWDPSRQAYVPAAEAPNGDTAAVVSASRGWWVRFDEPAAGLVWGPTVPVRQPYSIDLQPGWNLLASPFATPVSWSLDEIRVRSDGVEKTLREAQAAGWMEDFAWGWDGNAYSLVYHAGVLPEVASTLEPFRGYWVQAHRPATLVLPPPP